MLHFKEAYKSRTSTSAQIMPVDLVERRLKLRLPLAKA